MSIAPNDERLLDLLLSWEEARARGRDIPAEHLCAECPELLAELQRRIGRLKALAAPLDASDTCLPPGADAPDSPQSLSDDDGVPASRYRRLRLHATGGLGEIYVAHDEELNREVALKEIRGPLVRDRHSRARFLMEAEVTGNLAHPGVVPVYGLGAHPDGRLYYAMRLIEGESLKDGIARFHGEHGSAGSPPSEHSLELRRLLRRIIDVCNAVGYAHSRGVIHRDLKPANIMLGAFGETLVVDWGLAKVHGRTDTPDAGGKGPFQPRSAGDIAVTQPGTASGTPAYMSPEQAEGNLDRLGPRSDIYSLGATLYCLLTGRAPFEDDSLQVILRKVKAGQFSPPRLVQPGVDRALEAVCLKAMALEPAGRYSSAQAVALDLERWLADEPVSARREPLSQRLRRWPRRHRTVAASTAVALVAGVIGLGVVAGIQARHNSELILANAATSRRWNGRRSRESRPKF
jgi:eukaryotic-like serine/threonine-protein kinase